MGSGLGLVGLGFQPFLWVGGQGSSGLVPRYSEVALGESSELEASKQGTLILHRLQAFQVDNMFRKTYQIYTKHIPNIDLNID